MSYNAEEYGKTAYNAYWRESNGKSLVSGAQLPQWEQLSDNIQIAVRGM